MTWWPSTAGSSHVDAINTTGLRLSGVSGDRTVASITAATSLAGTAPCDLYIIATKAASCRGCGANHLGGDAT